MSRGFVKEEDQEEAPVIPPRAALPKGVTNYVTPQGYQALLEEKEALETEQKNLPTDNETEHRRASMTIDGKLKLLNERIGSARIIKPEQQNKEEVRFGAVVTFRNKTGKQKFQVVGVDEANIKEGKISFTAPIARVLTGQKIGDTAQFKHGTDIQNLEILNITYPE